jgi:hypothetical protein
LDAKGNAILMLLTVDIDTLAFRADAELKEEATLENNSFYFTSVDENITTRIRMVLLQI